MGLAQNTDNPPQVYGTYKKDFANAAVTPAVLLGCHQGATIPILPAPCVTRGCPKLAQHLHDSGTQSHTPQMNSIRGSSKRKAISKSGGQVNTAAAVHSVMVKDTGRGPMQNYCIL
ncbi:hypothetical protein ElyMa_002394500 [Elysia marginata]|uniref:Uncharacterized protein n=1 Tax=Elysia marginata TaxID=1093978 RepID=A0AAV4GD07_9GAST|nr:hypothetical protein ElyMa_002394500 [Elysia marginata]